VSTEQPGPTEDSQHDAGRRAEAERPQGEAERGQGEPSEEELRAAYEAELSRLTSADLIAQAIVSLLNVAARRLEPAGSQAAMGGEPKPGGPAAGTERDLDQVRDAIDAVRALLEILERRVPEGLRPLRDALSQLQMAYAREVQGGATGAAGGAAAAAGSPGQGSAGEQPPGAGAEEASEGQAGPGEAGPAQRSGRLWVPGS
jgi:hypothetical protein